MEGMGTEITADPSHLEGRRPLTPTGRHGEQLGAPERRKAILAHLRATGEAAVSSLPTALEMCERPRTTVIVLGGRVRHVTAASVERWATRMLRDMQPDLAIIGANGVDLDGWLTTPHASVAEVKETALSVSQRALFVGSHTKFARSTLCRFGHARQFERIITGTELRSSIARRIVDAGGRLDRV